MTSELVSKLFSSVSGRNPSPNQIKTCIEKYSSDRIPVDELWELMPSEIKLRFVSNTGRLKGKKHQKFLKSLDVLMDNFRYTDLLKLSVECIKKDGGVNIEELDKILSGQSSE